ncbi:hypothetical protein V6N13_004918 [Hibiscus sabdariffa]|uniref:Uncharacterized protein n=1 Tax=Hibiscus sabdariffa TaxID=183260 RepID=A0ABR2S076_9ROSI
MTPEVVVTDSLIDTVVGDTFNDNSVENIVLAKSATILTPNSSHLERIWEGNKREDPRVLGWLRQQVGWPMRRLDSLHDQWMDRDNSDVTTLVSQDVPLHEQNVQELDLVDGQLRGDDESALDGPRS